MLAFRYFAVVVGVLAGLTSGVVGVPPSRTEPTVSCTKSSRTDKLTMRFVTDLRTDPINHVYGLRNISNENTWMDCQFQNTSGTYDNGEEYNHLEVTTVIDMINFGNTENGCGVKEVTKDGMTGYMILLNLKQEEALSLEMDGVYSYTCYQDESTDLHLVVDQTVSAPVVVQPDIYVPEVVIEVVHQINQGNQQFIPINNNYCVIGEDLKLRVTITNDRLIDHQTPWGAYFYLTSITSTSDGQDYEMIVGDDGCKMEGNDVDLTYGWVRTSFDVNSFNGAVTAVYETGEFRCRRFLDSNEVFFLTFYDFCVSVIDSEEMCLDYCAYEPLLRKRRQDSSNNGYNVTTTIEILTQAEADQRNAPNTPGGNMYIIAPIIAAVSVLLVALVFVAVFICLVRKRRNVRSRHSDVDSRASSDRKLPVF